MITADEAYQEAASHVRLAIARNEAPTLDDIRRAVDASLKFLAETQGEGVADLVDAMKLARAIETETAIWQPEFSSLEDHGDDHAEWLADERADIEFRFWNRYRGFALDSGLPPQVVRKLDESTDRILASLESPRREGPWDRRGLVVGHVQAGKTGNYTGLICKAIDAGYRLIVVLAGVHESLRCQTQERIEEGILGYDARFGQAGTDDQAARHRVGVGASARSRLLSVHSYTSRDGDFTSTIARRVGPLTGADPVVLVVKKNKSVLENLIAWSRTGGFTDPDTGRALVRDTPLLVIDDEADNASVNTKALDAESSDDGAVETDPTTINRLIRQLLRLHDKSAYVGYTATPFANIFIYEDSEHSAYGQDLFPRSFIVRLPPPENYVGPARVFGLAASDETREAEAVEPLGIVRSVRDADSLVLDPKRKDSGLGPLPGSLLRAVQSFVLAGAVRFARGQSTQHNSMLVHVTRFVMVQDLVAESLDDLVGKMRERVRYGDDTTSVPIRDELRALWEADFVPTYEGLGEADRGDPVSWDDVDRCLVDFLERIRVYKVNGTAQDVLQYRDNDDSGLAVIAVGGDKLSRGLTLEGLTVSYYLRTTRMYDTLMQMGRWFGYRPGYLDVCRLYTTPELERWYSHITMANEELNRRFDEMAAQDRNPREFGLLVQTHPDGLLVTARTKMRNAHGMKLDFSGSFPETTAFDSAASVHRENAATVEAFLDEISRGAAPEQHRKRDAVWLWPYASGDQVARFLDAFHFSASAYRVNGSLMAKFIRSAARHDELVDWCVAVVGRGMEDAPKTFTVGGVDVGGLVRDAREEMGEVAGGFSVHSITSAPDELLDLSEAELAEALRMTKDRLDSGAIKRKRGLSGGPDGISARRARPRSRGLLLLYPIIPEVAGDADVSVDVEGPLFGLAASFPYTRDTKPVDYKVNNVFWTSEVLGE